MSTSNNTGQAAVAVRTLVNVVERLEDQASTVQGQANELLTILGVPNEGADSAVPAEPTVTSLDNRASRIEDVILRLNYVQERLGWAIEEVGKV